MIWVMLPQEEKKIYVHTRFRGLTKSRIGKQNKKGEYTLQEKLDSDD